MKAYTKPSSYINNYYLLSLLFLFILPTESLRPFIHRRFQDDTAPKDFKE